MVKIFKKNELLSYYVISIVISYLLFIFFFEPEEFALEFRKKNQGYALITKVESYEAEEETRLGVKYHDLEYIEYVYSVNGVKYTNGFSDKNSEYQISDKLLINYVESNPKFSENANGYFHVYNFFIRNFIKSLFLSIFIVLLIMPIGEKIEMCFTKLK